MNFGLSCLRESILVMYVLCCFVVVFGRVLRWFILGLLKVRCCWICV